MEVNVLFNLHLRIQNDLSLLGKVIIVLKIMKSRIILSVSSVRIKQIYTRIGVIVIVGKGISNIDIFKLICEFRTVNGNGRMGKRVY